MTALLSDYVVILVLTSMAITGAALYTSVIWAIAALLIFVYLIFVMSRLAPASLILLAPLLFLRVTEFISGVAIESGAYMDELYRSGFANGAFTRLLLIYGLYFAVASLIIEFVWQDLSEKFRASVDEWDRHLQPVVYVAYAYMLLVFGVLAYLAVFDSIPLLTGEDRFAFRWRLNSPILDAILNNRNIFAPLFGCLIVVPKFRKIGLAVLGATLLLTVSIGDKFTAVVTLGLTATIPLGLAHIASGRDLPLRTLLVTPIILSAITIPLILLAYGGADDFDGAIERLASRAAAQGELWFVTDTNYFQLFASNFGPLIADFQTWFDVTAQDPKQIRTTFGLYWIMSDYVPAVQLAGIMDTTGGYVFGQQPYLLRTVGYVGLALFAVLFATLHAALMWALVTSIARVNIVAVLIAGRVLVALYGYYYTGNLYIVFGVKNLIALLLLVGALYVGRYRVVWR
ncbi:DUF6418 domain-containing protein [Qipengyuania flava]|uniref:DUF6418 domain-containing protein n=1 Tax=Qipengyuania flava TaxID=192812 RepID=UPI001CD43FF5|nr:DUF6418 domain-containing protein [Qipengyuania flava]MCA0889548.1 DUF6418 domain-containing protein [Qipengyuania flava]